MIKSADELCDFLKQCGYQSSNTVVAEHRDMNIELETEWNGKVFRNKVYIKDKVGNIRYVGNVGFVEFPKQDIEITYYDSNNNIYVSSDRKIISDTKVIKDALKCFYGYGNNSKWNY